MLHPWCCKQINYFCAAICKLHFKKNFLVCWQTHSVRFEQRGHWQNEESCLLFLGATNSKQLEGGFPSLSIGTLRVKSSAAATVFGCVPQRVQEEQGKALQDGWGLWQTSANTTFWSAWKVRAWYLEAQLGDVGIELSFMWVVFQIWSFYKRKFCLYTLRFWSKEEVASSVPFLISGDEQGVWRLSHLWSAGNKLIPLEWLAPRLTAERMLDTCRVEPMAGWDITKSWTSSSLDLSCQSPFCLGKSQVFLPWSQVWHPGKMLFPLLSFLESFL